MDFSDGCAGSKAYLNDSIEEEIGSQTATQPIHGSGMATSPAESDEEMDEEQKPWGMLYPYRAKWRPVELRQQEVSIGRSSHNTHTILESETGKRVYDTISKVQCVVRTGAQGVCLEDKSSNGTWVNNKLVGKNKKRIIEHNMDIKFSNVKAYVYMSTNADYIREYPAELRQKYVISKELGKGACGKVHLGFRLYDKSYCPVAIKIMCKAKIQSPAFINEIRILNAIDHPCCIKYQDCFETATDYYIVLEFAPGGELFDRISEKLCFSEGEAKFIFFQIVSAIQYLHSKKIAHRDLKPENILLSGDDDDFPLVKISDMGLSKSVDFGSELRTFCGTPQYLAPEVVASRGKDNCTYDFKVDMWSLGVILYILLSGCPPFNPNRSDKPLIAQICDGDYCFPASRWAKISKSAINLVTRLMEVNPRKRFSADQALAHPWFKGDAVERAKRLIQAELPQLDEVDGGPEQVHTPCAVNATSHKRLASGDMDVSSHSSLRLCKKRRTAT